VAAPVSEAVWSFDGAGRLTDLAHVKGDSGEADYRTEKTGQVRFWQVE